MRLVLAQAANSELNWWDGLLEFWVNLPAWGQAIVAALTVAFLVALGYSVLFWAARFTAIRSGPTPQSVPTAALQGWAALPGWAKAVQFAVVPIMIAMMLTAVAAPPATLGAVPRDVAFGGVVVGGRASMPVRLSNEGTPGSRAISIQSMEIVGPDAADFIIDADADIAIPYGEDGSIRILFAPDSTGRKQASLVIEHTGANHQLVLPLTGAGARVVRINAGGPGISGDPSWAADTGFLSTIGTNSEPHASVAVNTEDLSIPAEYPEELFHSRRTGTAGTLEYEVPVEPGEYEVRLYLAAPTADEPPLDISIDGTLQLESFDVAASAGTEAGVMVPLVVTAEAPTLHVELASSDGTPWVNGIEIVDVAESAGVQLAADAALDLGPLVLGMQTNTDLHLAPTGDPLVDPTIVLAGTEITGATDFTIAGVSGVLGHGRTLIRPVVFTPGQRGIREATLRVNHSGAGTTDVGLTGFGWSPTDDSIDIDEDGTVSIAVLTNDGDPDGAMLIVTSVDRPSSGTATTDGRTVTYQPGTNFHGVVTFRYQVRDAEGHVEEASITVNVADINDPPSAVANGPYTGTTRAPIRFNPSGSVDVDGFIASYRWSFGDGFSSASRTPSHRYAQPGTYRVTLTVTDNDGLTDTSVATATVAATLDASRTGDGSGTLFTSPTGIDCGATCTTTFPEGTPVTVFAVPASGSIFAGWSGSCTGVGSCALTMSTDRAVTAEFRRLFELEVTKTGSGTGVVTGAAGGIDCGTDCTETLVSGDVVTLLATSVGNSRFDGWIGCDLVAGSVCTVSVDADTTVSARFTQLYDLTVTKSGDGTGIVSSTPDGITCGLNCVGTFAAGTAVTLTATPGADAAHSGWAGCDSTAGNTCVITMSSDRTVDAEFTQRYLLSVAKDGDGTGTVTSTPAGINCGTDCSESYLSGTTVTLTATPAAGSSFTGWNEGGCFGSATCTVTMDAAKAVTATFTARYTLSVTRTGAGSGTVTSTPPGIDCGSDCSQTYLSGQVVTLSATAFSGSRFTGWGGACSGTGSCTVSMTAAKSVTAEFSTVYVLTVTKDGDGSGTVTSVPAGINCGVDCSHAFLSGTQVTLTAIPSAGSTFTGWTGGGCGTSPSCTVTMSFARTVTAHFARNKTLTVTKDGDGSGTVTSTPAGINCGGDCSQTYSHGTVVTLSANAFSGSQFTGWSGGGCTGTGTCTTTMTASKTVTATFTRVYALTVIKTGGGSGTVTSSPAGINCGNDCTQGYLSGTTVTLTATPSAGSSFNGWSGGGCFGAGTCTVTMDGAKSVIATFTARYTLTVSKSGNGSGVVTSSPGGIDCGSDCSQTYQAGTEVTLTATAFSGSRFVGWSGGGCSGTGGCTVTMDSATSVTATFTSVYTLTVTKSGDGSGTVTSSPAGINCGSDCSQSYDSGTTVTLTASPAAGSAFDGWSGSCSGTGTCTVTMNQTRSVTAQFTRVYTLTVMKSGDGTVTSSPAGINCGSDCSQSYDSGTTVTLTATPAAGFEFTGWGGACSGTGACTVTMNSSKTVSATFTGLVSLTVTKSGDGSGTVTSSPAGINCGADCSQSYLSGTVVTLTATPAAASSFTGWSGACTGTGTCTVTMTQARSVNAAFSTDKTLTVTTSGDGSGTVTSSPAGINCGADCTQSYQHGTMVTLTATPAAGSSVTWSGSGCTGGGTCTVTMTQARSVNAAFNTDKTLTVTTSGNGTGTVTGLGINCGIDCSQTYQHGTVVTLTATADSGSQFTGWSGACTGTGTCTVTMTQARNVNAGFTSAFTLTVNTTGGGAGNVSGPGINCGLGGADCSESYPVGTVVTLTATPDAGSVFAAWQSACSGTGVCTVIMNGDRQVNARFNVV